MTPDEMARLRSELQGNVLVAYRLPFVRHLIVRVDDGAGARRALAEMLRPGGSAPAVTSDEPYEGRQRTPCLNVGMTYLGLRALGVPGASLRTFPPEFREGMVARAARLGDVGTSDPRWWLESLRRPAAVHLVLTVHADTSAATTAAAGRVLAAGRGAFHEVGHLDGEALVQDPDSGLFDLYHRVPAIADDGTPVTHRRGEHFGFRDGFAQPRFEGLGRRAPARPAEHGEARAYDPYEPLGIVLLGHPTRSPVAVPAPEPHELGHQGSFNAFRALAQDVAGFRRYVAGTAATLGIDEELLKAKMCGRWPNGVPLSLAGTAKEARHLAEEPLDDFDFADDQDGAVCPVGSHIRRCNPRAAHLVQRASNRARRLVRRGMPFGPWLPEGEEARHPRERGLLGSFLCASLSTQFEAMQYDWINLGLQDPSITSTNDPLVGANDPATSRFTFSDGERWHTVRALPRFVETIGGAYCFVPSMEALRWIAGAKWEGKASRRA